MISETWKTQLEDVTPIACGKLENGTLLTQPCFIDDNLLGSQIFFKTTNDVSPPIPPTISIMFSDLDSLNYLYYSKGQNFTYRVNYKQYCDSTKDIESSGWDPK